MLLAGPEQRDQQVGIQQVTVHPPSVSSRRTSSVVTFGESAGSWNMQIPFSSREAVAAFKPRRTRSETVLPSETPRTFARRAANSKTSSSSAIVVLIKTRCHLFYLMSIIRFCITFLD